MLELFMRALPMLQQAIVITLELAAGAFVLGTTFGLLIAFARNARLAPVRWFSYFYVSVFRGTPLLVQLLLIYFGLPQFGIVMDPIWAALLALTLFETAYISEDFRSGINGVDRGQWEAAMSMDMSYWTTIRRIILPQALRVATPSLGSRLITLVKNTSLASTVTVVELTRVAEQIGSSTFRYMEMFLIVGAIYWIINQVLTIIQTWLEVRLSRSLR